MPAMKYAWPVPVPVSSVHYLIIPIFQQTHDFPGHHFNVIGEGKIMIPLLPVNDIHGWYTGITAADTSLTGIQRS